MSTTHLLKSPRRTLAELMHIIGPLPPIKSAPYTPGRGKTTLAELRRRIEPARV